VYTGGHSDMSIGSSTSGPSVGEASHPSAYEALCPPGDRVSYPSMARPMSVSV
jgi:hypothetical protein